MFWYWVGAVLVVVLALAAWTSYRSRRLRGTTGVRWPGAFKGKRRGLSETEVAKARAEVHMNLPDWHAGTF